MNRPDILLLMADQMRADCLSCAGHSVVQTPHLDWLAAEGVRFSWAYTECPVCVPARRSLLTGRFPVSHGVMMNHVPDLSLPGPTLPEVLTANGYQTHLCGKLHLAPPRKLHGFMSADWADNAKAVPKIKDGKAIVDDYQRFLLSEGVRLPGFSDAHGLSSNSPVARPWHADERLHFTNWVTDRAVEFLDRRDPTMPFFLKVSYLHPHPPCTPPWYYYDRYLAAKTPPRPVGDWARVFEGPHHRHHRDPNRVCLDPVMQHQLEAGYYGSINHIDDQINRILTVLPHPENTLILFLSDHGEMLGDHQWFRKHTPWEGAAHIPFIVVPPRVWGIEPGQVCNVPVQLADVMPTCLSSAGVAIPDSVDGSDLLPVLKGDSAPREFVHGECAEVATLNSGMHFLTDGRQKYIWFPGRGEEQLFDLRHDPLELDNLAESTGGEADLPRWRERLIKVLEGRPEGFVREGRLARLDGPTAYYSHPSDQKKSP